eukprot:2093552-Pyramimonas_sp.AAC.1
MGKACWCMVQGAGSARLGLAAARRTILTAARRANWYMAHLLEQLTADQQIPGSSLGVTCWKRRVANAHARGPWHDVCPIPASPDADRASRRT